MICSDENFVSLCPFPPRPINFGVPEGRPGGRGGDRAATQGRSSRPTSSHCSREQILDREIDHWVNQTSTGQLFAFGVLVAMIVAAVVVYQVLSNDVREHLPEYATLKAMGYSFRRLAVVVVAVD